MSLVGSELCIRDWYREGNENAVGELMEKYKGLVNSIARSFFLRGVDRDDIVQERMIGLFNAIVNFNLESKVTFITYAHECIKNRLLDYIRNGNRLKNKALDDSVPISEMEETDSRALTPEEIAINEEEAETIKLIILSSLTDDERNIFNMFYEGKSYAEIAEVVGKNTKYVDNALQKIRRKIKAQFSKR